MDELEAARKAIKGDEEAFVTLMQLHIEFTLHDYQNKERKFSLFSKITDANGKVFYSSQEAMYNTENTLQWDITLEPIDYVNPLQLEIIEYPNYITGDVIIELKK